MTRKLGFRKMEAHGQAPHPQHRVQAPSRSGVSRLAGETLHGLSKRHDICRNLIRVWVQKYEAGAFDEDSQSADLLQQYEARIAALERLVGKQALELEFLAAIAHTRFQSLTSNSAAVARATSEVTIRSSVPGAGRTIRQPLNRSSTRSQLIGCAAPLDKPG